MSRETVRATAVSFSDLLAGTLATAKFALDHPQRRSRPRQQSESDNCHLLTSNTAGRLLREDRLPYQFRQIGPVVLFGDLPPCGRRLCPRAFSSSWKQPST